MAWIYILESPSGKMYVGQTTRSIKERISVHKCDTKRYNYPICNANRKYGIDNFNIYFFECEEEDLDYFERGFIKQLNTLKPYGYNLNDGGNKNKHLHESTKEKISKAIKGKTGWYNKGRLMSDEQKRIIGEKARERYLKKGHPMFGRKHKIESIEKIRNIKLGRKNPKIAHGLNGNAKKVMNIDTGEIYETIRDAERRYNLSKGSVQHCCYGKTKTSAGYHWEFV